MRGKHRWRIRDLAAEFLKRLTIVIVVSLVLLYAAMGGVATASAAQPGTWSASYDQANNCIDITATPPVGQHVETTITWWDATNTNDMQTAVSGSTANPVTYAITSSVIQQALGTGAPDTGNQYVVQCYFTEPDGEGGVTDVPGAGGQATVTWGDQGSGTAQGTAPVGGGSGQNTEDQGSPMERFLAIPIDAVANTIASLAGLMPLDQLIFGSGAFLSQSAWDTAMQWYQGLTLYAVLFMAIVLLILAWQASRAGDERDRAEVYKGIWRWVFGFLMLYLVPWFATAIFTVNGALVQFAAGQLHGISISNAVSTGNVLSDAFIALYMAGLLLYFNILYVIRAVFTLLLLAIAPIVLWTYVLDPTRQSFTIWSAELFSNIMMQSAHALTLSFFFAILTTIQGAAAGTGVAGMLGQWWAKIVIITMVIPVGQFLRNLINVRLNFYGLKEEQIAGGAAAGLGGILGVPRILGTMTGLKFGGAATGAGSTGQGPGGDGGGFNTPPDTGGTGGSSSATASSSGLAQNYNMAARGAAMLGGVMGTVAGMPVGQSQTFAQAGAAAGRRIVSNVGQAHQAIAQANQNGTSKSAAIGQAAGALLAGATGAQVAGTAMAMGSRLLHGAPKTPVNSGNSPAQGGPGVNSSLQPSQSGTPAHPAATGAEAGAGVQTPPENTPGSGASQSVPASTESSASQRPDVGQNRPTGLEDIIDFNRLTR
jgi:hypothetical protein